MVILALASMVGCAQALTPTPTTARAATPAVVGSPTAQATPTGPHDEKLVEHNAETRFQLDLHLSDAALAQFTPSGWSSCVEPSGAARDANLCVIFIDGVTVNNQTGQPMGTNGNRLVQLVAPFKDPSGTTAMLVVGRHEGGPGGRAGAVR